MTFLLHRSILRGIRIAAVSGSACLSVADNAAAQPGDSQALIERGRAVAIAADCAACHTRPGGGKPFAGGYPIASPIGTIVSTNITPSTSAGIGEYTEGQFAQAVRQGIRKDGSHLYPAMPYNAYAGITDQDLHALYVYFMQEVEPVDDQPAARTDLPFPFNLRFAMAPWNLLYARTEPFKPDPGKSAEVNRGAYLVNVLGHCSACHSPRNFIMGERNASAYLAGGPVGPWHAPNITSDPVSGIGDWTVDELTAYLGTGRAEGRGQAAGGMAEAVQNSLQYLPESDLKAIAVYLKSVPPIRDPGDTRPADQFGTADGDEARLRGATAIGEDGGMAGAALYSANCASCHQPSGEGSDNQAYPSLFRNSAVEASRSANLVAAILYGVEREAAGRHVLMPDFGPRSYATSLSDREIADISNYVLTRFGNAEARITPTNVATARAGGPVPFLGQIKPLVGPLMVAGLAVLVAAPFGVWALRRRSRAPSAPTAG